MPHDSLGPRLFSQQILNTKRTDCHLVTICKTSNDENKTGDKLAFWFHKSSEDDEIEMWMVKTWSV